MKTRWIDRHLVVAPHYIGLCLSDKEFKRELKRLKIEREEWPPFLCGRHANATCHFFDNTKTGKRIALVCLGSTSKVESVQIQGLLVHESVHIWQAIRDDIGERDPSSEFEAYSIQSIAQGLMQAYEDMTKKGAKRK